MPDLTADEQKFFETGELPDALAQVNVSAPEQAILQQAVQQAQAEPVSPVEQNLNAPDAAEMLRRSLVEEQTRRIQLEQRLAQLESAKQVQQIASPDENTDPLGAMMHQLKTVQDSVQNLSAAQQQQLAAAQQSAQLQQFSTSLQQIRAEFEKTSPDFGDAYTHLRNVHTADMRELGIPDAQIQHALAQSEISLAATALQQGKNPAAVVYNMAKRYGYAPKTVATAIPNTTVVTPLEKLALAAKGAPAAFNLPKGIADTPLTYEGLKDASNSDLNKLVQDDKAWANLVGGNANDIF